MDQHFIKRRINMKKLLKKVLKVILIVLVILIVGGIVVDIFWEILNTSGYTEEELRIFCNSNDRSEFGLDFAQCMTVW